MMKYLFSFLLTCIVFFTATAQQISYDFATLSAIKYADKIKQFEKFKAPKVFTDKASQVWYDEFVTDRNSTLSFAFRHNDIIYDSILLDKCNSILKRIALANPTYRFDTIKLYINRSLSANAACYGEGTVFINLGLFLWIDNDDELALVLGHEFAHQLLNHSESAMKKSIATLTSDAFKKE